MVSKKQQPDLNCPCSISTHPILVDHHVSDRYHTLNAYCRLRPSLEHLDIATIVVIALAFGARHDFLGGQIADSFKKSSLAELASDTLVDAVLNGINILVASDFCLGELIYGN